MASGLRARRHRLIRLAAIHLCFAAALCAGAALLALEWRGLMRIPVEPAAGLAVTQTIPPRLEVLDAARRSAEAQAILKRPMFSPSRRPPPLLARDAALPRLSGVIIAPWRQLALLQTDESEGARAQALGVGDHLPGWQVTMIDPKGVMLTGKGRVLRLAVRRAAVRPSGLVPPGLVPPGLVPIERVVLMRDKRTNPQLAW